MTTVTAIPVSTYPSGTYTVAATPVDDAITSIGIAVQRCTTADPTIWPNSADTITFTLEIFIGGQWITNWFVGSDSGGIVTDKHGVDVPTMNVQADLPAGTSRQLRASVVLNGVTTGSIKTGATVTVL